MSDRPLLWQIIDTRSGEPVTVAAYRSRVAAAAQIVAWSTNTRDGRKVHPAYGPIIREATLYMEPRVRP